MNMFGSFRPSIWSSTSHSLLGSKEPTLLCNQVEAAAGQALEIEAPIFVPQANWRELQVTASTTGGQAIGSVRRDLKELTSLSNGPFLVAVYCTDDAICRNVQSQIAFGENGGSASRMNQNLRLTTFRGGRGDRGGDQGVQNNVVAGAI